MNDDSLVNAYELRDITISPSELLLDPKNPRIILKVDQSVNYTTQQLASTEVQDYIMSVIDKSEFRVDDLIDSIKNRGFIDSGNRMIVERVDGSGKYLVLEGNRRLTAIKRLLRDQSTLSQPIVSSISSFRAYELVCTPGSNYTREQIILELLGMLHLQGQLDWGPMERAYYIYNAYLAELDKLYYFDEPFYDAEACRNCGSTFDIKPNDVRSELAIYSIYSQLQLGGYSVREEHYTLLNLAVRAKVMNSEYFELDWYDLQLSSDGLERFNKLCLEDDKIVHNPIDFKKVTKIYRNGTRNHMALVESGEYLLDDIMELVDQRTAKTFFVTELEKIEQKLSSLLLVTPRGIKKEEQLVRAIRDRANKILRILTR
ncbi:ParB N-terminal domain-containing protein [Chloroflexota bacterium]